MDVVPDDKARGLHPPIWATYKEIIEQAEGKSVSSQRFGTFRV